ncbi:hypothetical protein [Bacteroides finegoldii]
MKQKDTEGGTTITGTITTTGKVGFLLLSLGTVSWFFFPLLLKDYYINR